MKILKSGPDTRNILSDTNSWVRFAAEIATICVLYTLSRYIFKRMGKASLEGRYWFLAALLFVIIIHNLALGGWQSPKDLIFIGVLAVMGIWVWRSSQNASSGVDSFLDQQTVVQALGPDDMDYNLPEAGRTESVTVNMASRVGSNLNEAHPEVNQNELVWGNRAEHYDFVPDDIPGYLELDELRKLKRLQKKVKKDKNYKYLADIKPYDPQSMNRPDGDPGTEVKLTMRHGLDNVLLDAAYQNEAYKMPKEVLDALSCGQHNLGYPSVWKEGDAKFRRRVNGDTKYVRNNGVPGSWYKYLKEPEPTLTPDKCPPNNKPNTTTTTRPDNLKTSPDTGAGPVMQVSAIPDEMIEANNKFRTAEYFTNSISGSVARTGEWVGIDNDNNPYSLHSDSINTRMPGCSDKISQYATNYPLVSIESLEKISNNCAIRLDGLCPN
jgi:hypothetical protein